MKEKVYEFDQIFKALGDKHRIQILNMLMERERNAGELLEAVDVVQSTLSHHMKSLSESGLVEVRKTGKWTYYSVSQAAVQAAHEFLEQYLNEEGGEKKADAGEERKKAGTAAVKESRKKADTAAVREGGKKAETVPGEAVQKKEAKAKPEKNTVQSHQSKNSQDIFASADGKKEKKGDRKEHEDVFASLPVTEKSAEKTKASKKNENSGKKEASRKKEASGKSEEKKKKSSKSKKEKKKKDKK